MKNVFKSLLASAMIAVMASCSVGPTELADGRVTLGGSFLTQADADSRQVTKADGTVLSWTRTKPDETSVAKYAITAYGTVKSLDSGYKTVKSNNDTATAQQAASLKAQTDQAKIAADAAAKAGQQANVGKAIEKGVALPAAPVKVTP